MALNEHHEAIQAVQKVTRGADPVESIGSEGQETTPDSEKFTRLMAEKTQPVEPTRVEADPSAKRPNPIETVQQTQQAVIQNNQGNGFQGLIAEARKNVQRMEGLQDTLKKTDLHLSRPIRASMQRSLIHVDESLKIALSRVGVDYTPPATQANGLVAPVQKFLGYLSNSQTQLENLSSQLTTVHGGESVTMTPALMLGLQLKMGVITQQVEFFASLLNKALESTKTVMNVQV